MMKGAVTFATGQAGGVLGQASGTSRCCPSFGPRQCPSQVQAVGPETQVNLYRIKMGRGACLPFLLKKNTKIWPFSTSLFTGQGYVVKNSLRQGLTLQHFPAHIAQACIQQHPTHQHPIPRAGCISWFLGSTQEGVLQSGGVRTSDIVLSPAMTSASLLPGREDTRRYQGAVCTALFCQPGSSPGLTAWLLPV